MTAKIVLASGSVTRRSLLEAAGLSIIVDPPDVDEGVLKRDCRDAGASASETALVLAAAKARKVALRHPGDITLGADQMLECDGVWFDKPLDRSAAARQIAALAGRTHALLSAVLAVRNGDVIWQIVERAELTMRPLSNCFIESYLDMSGDSLFGSVGAYQIEGPGIQLFSHINGDHSTIMGMPLLPVLDFLRREGVIAA